MEPDDTKMRQAAHLMVSTLAGSLALVTCKEPLRTSMSNHLHQLISQASTVKDTALVDQVVTSCANDNLELGCMLIQKAATEKAMRDIDEQLGQSYQVRRKHLEQTGNPYFDMGIFKNNQRYPQSLPPALLPRPSPGGLKPAQLMVYNAFKLQTTPAVQQQPGQTPAAPAAKAQQARGPAGNVPVGAPTSIPVVQPAGRGQQPPQQAAQPHHASGGGSGRQHKYNTQQALQGFYTCVSQLDKLIASEQQRLRMLPDMDPSKNKPDALLANPHVTSLLQGISRTLQMTALAHHTEAGHNFAQRVFNRMLERQVERVAVCVYVAVLQALQRAGCSSLRSNITQWVVIQVAQRHMDLFITITLLQADLVLVPILDEFLAKQLTSSTGGGPPPVLQFVIPLLRNVVVKMRRAPASDFHATLAVLRTQARRQGRNADGNLVQLLNEVHALASAPGAQDLRPQMPAASNGQDQPGMRAEVERLLVGWVSTVESNGGEQGYGSFLQNLQRRGYLQGDEAIERLFRIMAELCIERFVQTGYYLGIDSFSKFILLLVKFTNRGSPQTQVLLLSKILIILVRLLVWHCDETMRKVSRSAYQGSVPNSASAAAAISFDPRPFLRLFSNIMEDFTAAESGFQSEAAQFRVLTAIGNTLHAMQPLRVPQFAFAWTELICHRSFMPLLLSAPNKSGWPLMHALLVDLLRFMQPYLRKVELTDSIRTMYKGLLRVLLVLLHDFPSFLSEYHFAFCDVIPPTCIQLRNLILSAFPRQMHLPDPFTPNLKVDRLPESAQAPHILSDYRSILESNNLLRSTEEYLKSGKPANFPATLLGRLVLPTRDQQSRYNVPLINAVVLHVGVQAIAYLSGQSGDSGTVPMELFQRLSVDLDPEGRYHFFNAIANQLRFPNSHTHYFSCVLLYLFAESRDLRIKEQITRVLLERLIVHRPHPWGLLITFIELIKNQHYKFWDHPFTHCAEDIKRLFESVARSCMGNAPAAGSTGPGQVAGSAPPASSDPSSHPGPAQKSSVGR